LTITESNADGKPINEKHVSIAYAPDMNIDDVIYAPVEKQES